MIEALLPLWPAFLFAPLVLWFMLARGKTLMMIFQQEEYDDVRFLAWFGDNKAFDRKASLWMLAAVLVGLISQSTLVGELGATASAAAFLVWPLMVAAFVHGALVSATARNSSKKPLVMTARVKRILTVYLGFAVALYLVILLIAVLAPRGTHYAVAVDMDGIGFASLPYNWQVVLASILFLPLLQLPPLLLVLANKLLEPAEERVKAGFRAEAIEKFSRLQPKVIAITGSFGKTSTKHILSHILGAAAPTLATPGSVNTDMGITRVIREQLEGKHQFFIVEMGAYGPGSIARLCRLTPPDVGLITAIGAAHYERFKTLETVARAKFELAEAVFKKGGQVVVNRDGIAPDLLAERLANVPGDYRIVGHEGDVVITNWAMTPLGVEVTVRDGAEDHILRAPLYGSHQAGNVALAAASARALGLPWAAIKGALASVPQIRHRLEVTRSSSGPTIINDAYNSNPVGFKAALECLDVLVEEGGRRILVTPGMVELGDKHNEEHKALGALAAQHCDIVLVVTPDRIPSFVEALNKANDGSVTVMMYGRQADAEAWVKGHWRKGDAVLFENNLPDLYEAVIRF
ncbi:Mur ligase family protein [Kordiimonas aestuarii]|uniref:Mur ligase family protein n=1 Tax=Kordiimonas aestuarii TaxID=1005925 RepID=UPI0021CF48E2|nr:UDP-N-acetylmuramoyl-tripeptide--D-alanyl-D-alanine ligase [Kordiimonas aestuarii]